MFSIKSVSVKYGLFIVIEYKHGIILGWYKFRNSIGQSSHSTKGESEKSYMTFQGHTVSVEDWCVCLRHQMSLISPTIRSSLPKPLLGKGF